MSTKDAFIATTRFGLGPKRGELTRVADDPRGWLKAQLGDVPLPAGFDGLRPGHETFTEFVRAIRGTKEPDKRKVIRKAAREIYLKEAALRTRAQIESDAPFRERLVVFWSNHFTVSVKRPQVIPMAGAFEREAIRPHVTGRFVDMLMAVIRHPAMLVYLDNVQSFGPNSRVGRRRNRGLNENLAREILELHTLGVDGGYAQTDVREFAKILTGWSLDRPARGGSGRFRFWPPVHEPGAKTLLGVRYEEAGEREGVAALEALSRHPATARFVATKLARQFIADTPPRTAVDRLARVFGETGGDLGALARTLIDMPEIWEKPLTKVKTPNDFVVSAFRATVTPKKPRQIVGSLRLFNQAPFTAPSPAGWPDTAADWVGPETLLQRADWAMTLSQRLAEHFGAEELLNETIGPVVRRETRQAVRRAPSPAEGLALVLSSPEFQRR